MNALGNLQHVIEKRRQTPLHRQKGVQILQPEVCKDIKSVRNMRMPLMKKLRGLGSAADTAAFFENNRQPHSNENRLFAGQGRHRHSQLRLTA